MDYLLARTMTCPRDVILLVNQCISEAVGNPSVGVGGAREAEGEYSRLRLRMLADEWFGDYANLLHFAEVLKQRRSSFAVRDMSENDCADLCVAHELARRSERYEKDVLSEGAKAVVDGTIDADEFRKSMVPIFYRVGLVGLKLAPHEKVSWSRGERRSVSSAEVNDATRVLVHKAFWRVLGIREP